MLEHAPAVRRDAEDRRSVERELEFELLLAPRCVVRSPMAVPARLLYLARDPFAVRFSFHIDTPRPVDWTFARSLLIDGLFRPSGAGDVRIWPSRTDEDRAIVCLSLTAPDGLTVLYAPALPVSAWLERTISMVPPGDERTEFPVAPLVSGPLRAP
ncbi:SsgA family sporulation/cell division regulator [Streptomyces violens]|uniref:SsgA family sporulation/cell division regulator n=1 Tax=Streptomyces violens TaxID=66377 RepID=UPI0006920E86|nr:SsgA family sporulation/cell division regulator [Streptomyces violens]